MNRMDFYKMRNENQCMMCQIDECPRRFSQESCPAVEFQEDGPEFIMPKARQGAVRQA